MPKYLIEVAHESNSLACLHSMQIFMSSGSHFLTNADWGCSDGVHKAWFVLEATDKDQALFVVPQAYHKDTTITQINKFTIAEVEEMIKQHKSVNA